MSAKNRTYVLLGLCRSISTARNHRLVQGGQRCHNDKKEKRTWTNENGFDGREDENWSSRRKILEL